MFVYISKEEIGQLEEDRAKIKKMRIVFNIISSLASGVWALTMISIDIPEWANWTIGISVLLTWLSDRVAGYLGGQFDALTGKIPYGLDLDVEDVTDEKPSA